MEFFVAEPQKFVHVKCLHAAAGSEEKRLFSQATLYTEENSSQMPEECLGVGGGGGGWGGVGGWGKISGLELTGIF